MSPESAMWIGYESPSHTSSFFDSTGRSAVYSNWSGRISNVENSNSNCAYIMPLSGEWDS